MSDTLISHEESVNQRVETTWSKSNKIEFGAAVFLEDEFKRLQNINLENEHVYPQEVFDEVVGANSSKMAIDIFKKSDALVNEFEKTGRINDNEISQALADSRRLGQRDVMRVIEQNIDNFFQGNEDFPILRGEVFDKTKKILEDALGVKIKLDGEYANVRLIAK